MNLERSIPFLTLICAVAFVGCGDDAPHAPVNLGGEIVQPLEIEATATVLIFARTDCPITNRYAPEIRRIHDRFVTRDVRFWLVYADGRETPNMIQKHHLEYAYGCEVLRDPDHILVEKVDATVTPEVGVFDGKGRLVYRGRINDRYVEFGKTRPEATEHDLIDVLESVLAGKELVFAETESVGCPIDRSASKFSDDGGTPR
jgi:hypothetical protein